MAAADSRIACAPLIYGYVNYAMAGFRPHRLAFADIPAAGTLGPVGSALGGTGIAVSAFSEARAEALDFAYWIASGDVQRGAYAAAGGQPGHAAAWEDAGVNAATGDFYRATRGRSKAPGCGRVTTATWRSSRRRRTGSTRGSSGGMTAARRRRSQPDVSREFWESVAGR